MQRVMNAPINTFFDITPVGKILVRFSKNLEVFKGSMFWSCMFFSNHLFALISTFVILGIVSPWNIIAVFLVGALLSIFAIPFMAIDNQLHKLSSSVWTPIHSYW